jgi:hypothetical protein
VTPLTSPREPTRGEEKKPGEGRRGEEDKGGGGVCIGSRVGGGRHTGSIQVATKGRRRSVTPLTSPCWPIRGEEQRRGEGGKDWGPRLRELDNPGEEKEDKGTSLASQEISLVSQEISQALSLSQELSQVTFEKLNLSLFMLGVFA